MTGGDKLDAYLQGAGRNLRAGTVRVGFLEGATYPDGKPVAMIAAIQNFGAPAKGIPPRPFFSNMIAEKSGGWGAALALALRDTGGDGYAALARVGEGIAGQLRQSVRDTNLPPLKPATIARKGFEKPLIESGHMLGSIDYEVVGGDGSGE